MTGRASPKPSLSKAGKQKAHLRELSAQMTELWR